MKTAVKFAAALLAGVITMMMLSRFYDKPKDVKEVVQQTPQAMTEAVEEIKKSEPVQKVLESEPVAKLSEALNSKEEEVKSGSGQIEEEVETFEEDVVVIERTIEERQQDVTRRQFNVIEGLLD